MLDIRHPVKRFGSLVAVDDVSFAVPQGEVLGFLGPNGADKSTTMKMITGFLAPDSGTAIVCGHDIGAAPVAAKRHIGYLPEGAPAYPDMTPPIFSTSSPAAAFSPTTPRRPCARATRVWCASALPTCRSKRAIIPRRRASSARWRWRSPI